MDIKIEDIDVSDDHILLSDILQGNDITVKQLATATGLAGSTLYKYLAGGCTIPSVVWRVVYKISRDARICRLFIGDVGQVIVPLEAGVKTKLKGDKLAGLIAMRQEQIGFEKQMLEALGSDDEKTKQNAIENLKRRFPDMITIQTQMLQAMTGSFEPLMDTNRH